MNFNKYAAALALLTTSVFAAEDQKSKVEVDVKDVDTEGNDKDALTAGENQKKGPEHVDVVVDENNTELVEKKRTWMGSLTGKTALIGYGVVGGLAVIGGGLYMFLGRKPEENDL